MEPIDQDQLVTWLEERGHSAAEIERILARLAQHDMQTIRDSVFDAINSRNIDFARLVEEMLSGGDAPTADDQGIDTTRE